MNLPSEIPTAEKAAAWARAFWRAALLLDGCNSSERTVDVARNITDDVLLLGQPHFDLPPSLQIVRPKVPDHRPNLGPTAGSNRFYCRGGRPVLYLTRL